MLSILLSILLSIFSGACSPFSYVSSASQTCFSLSPNKRETARIPYVSVSESQPDGLKAAILLFAMA